MDVHVFRNVRAAFRWAHVVGTSLVCLHDQNKQNWSTADTDAEILRSRDELVPSPCSGALVGRDPAAGPPAYA